MSEPITIKTEDPSETLHDLSLQLADGYQTALEVDTMLETLKDACGEESSGFMCAIILKRLQPVLNLLDLASHKIKKLEGVS